jgi:hypothetical protein
MDLTFIKIYSTIKKLTGKTGGFPMIGRKHGNKKYDRFRDSERGTNL